MQFPKMSIQEAIKTRTQFFTSHRRCNGCKKERRKWMSGWTEYLALCYHCYPPEIVNKGESIGQVNVHCRKVDNLMKKKPKVTALDITGGYGSTYSGYNTNTR